MVFECHVPNKDYMSDSIIPTIDEMVKIVLFLKGNMPQLP